MPFITACEEDKRAFFSNHITKEIPGFEQKEGHEE